MIYKRINDKGVKCLDVTLTQGGCSWLHAIVKIEKKRNDDGRRAIKATFEAHKSCKHVFIVDEDINIYNPLEVEWAMATRFQGNKNTLIKSREAGSSLDPSANPETGMTAKIGFDMTKPLEARESKNYEKARYPQVDPSKYMKV